MNEISHEAVIDYIIAGLGEGTPPWIKPWDDPQMGVHFNAITGNIYRISNPDVLVQAVKANAWTNFAWITAPQVRDSGGAIRDGEKPLVIEHKRGGWDYVFNIAQCLALPATVTKPSKEWENIDFVEEWITDCWADIDFSEDHTVEYVPDHDCIYIPMMVFFASAGSYYNALFHEIIHWSGHKDRLARDAIVMVYPDLETDRLEEVAAEIGAAFLCSDFGIGVQNSSLSYINGWLKTSRQPIEVILEAAEIAGQAIDYIKVSIACRTINRTPA